MKRKETYRQFTLTAIFGAIIMLLSLVPQLGFITILPGVSITIVHIPVIIGAFILGIKDNIILGFFFGLGSLITAFLRPQTVFDEAFRNPLISILPRMIFSVCAFYIAQGLKKLETRQHGKLFIYLIVTLVSGFAVYFGVDAAAQKVLENSSQNELLSTVRMYTIPISIVIIAMLAVIYYLSIMKKTRQNSYVTAVLILSTLAHTILVLTAVAVFNPQAFSQTFDNRNSVITWLLIILMSNGVIEAVVAAIAGTPAAIALLNAWEKEE